MRQTYRIGQIGAVILVVAVLFAEVACRIIGITDFPIYARSDTVGYYLVPNQHGVFLHKNHWYINAAGLNNDKPFEYKHPYTLLIGDSVVYGGNPVDYSLRIGTLVGKEIKQDVWSAATGGWSLFNELAYLAQLKEIVRKADHLIFIYDNGDLDGLAPWGGDLTHPTAPPLSSLFYVCKKYLFRHSSELPQIPEAITQNNDWQKKLDDLLAYYPGSITFLLYPDKKAFSDKTLWGKQTDAIKRYISSHRDRISVVDVGSAPSWNNTMYRDGIHPNADGSKIIAHLIAERIKN